MLCGFAVLLTAAVLSACGAAKSSPEAADNSTNGEKSSAEIGRSTANEEKSGAETVVLDVWYQEENTNSTAYGKMEEAAAEYEKAHPGVLFRLHALDSSSYKEKIAEDFTGKAEDIDVFYDWGPAKLTQLVEADRVLPLDSYVTAEKLSEIRQSSINAFRIDGKLYGLPMNSSMMLVYCNKALFEQAGAAIPTTYDELLAAADKLKGIGVCPLEVGSGDAWLAGALYESLAVREAGAAKCNAVLAGQASMRDDPAFRTAAEKMNELYQKGVLGSNPLQVTDTDALSDFLDGKAAMLLDGSWAAASIDNTPDRAAQDVVPIIFPLAEAGQYAGDYIGGTSVSYFVNKNTDNPAEAADAALFLAEWFGRRSCKLGWGFSCWDGTSEDLSPTLAAAQKLFNQTEQNVRSWDTVLDAEAARKHLEACQALLSDTPDFEEFLKAHDRTKE